MELALLTGERSADVLKFKRTDIRPRHAISAYLIQDENGQPLTRGALRSRFDKARTLAKVDFQFRDIQGKAATDTGNLAHSQKLLGHKNRDIQESAYDRALRQGPDGGAGEAVTVVAHQNSFA